MNEIEFFSGTSVYDALKYMDMIYGRITAAQEDWRHAAVSTCPDGCGRCCVDFEPDLLESEALYMAVWLYFNRRPVFDRLLATENIQALRKNAGEHPDGCVFFDPDSPEHCTIYGGRALICRLFGYSGDHDKNGALRWRPCRFIPDKLMNGIEHRTYTRPELQKKFGVLPPDMTFFASEVLSIFPGKNGTQLVRSALPAAVKKIYQLLSFIAPPEPDHPFPTVPRTPGKSAA